MMQNKRYFSKKEILNLSKANSTKRIQKFITKNNTCSYKILKGRKVKLTRYLESNLPRKDAKKRIQTFFVAIDIIKKSRQMTKRIHKKKREYEIAGYDMHHQKICVHIREETECGNRNLYIISSFKCTTKRENPLP